MITINISLPEKIREEARALIKRGYYASFSDLVRDSLRRLIESGKYEQLLTEAKKEEASGKAKLLRTTGDIDNFISSL